MSVAPTTKATARPARHGTARHGTARHGTAWHGVARRGVAAMRSRRLLPVTAPRRTDHDGNMRPMRRRPKRGLKARASRRRRDKSSYSASRGETFRYDTSGQHPRNLVHKLAVGPRGDYWAIGLRGRGGMPDRSNRSRDAARAARSTRWGGARGWVEAERELQTVLGQQVGVG